MNKFIKIMTVALLAVVTALTCFACANTNNDKDDPGLYYKKVSDGYLVYKYVDDGETEELNIATALGDIEDELATGEKLVIRSNIFKGNNTLKKIIVPDTVTEIQVGAFAGITNLEELVVPFIGKTANGLVEFSPETAEDLSVGSERTLAHFFGSDSFTGSTAITVKHGSAEGNSSTVYVPLKFNKISIVNDYAEYSVPMYAMNGVSKLIDISFDCNLVAIGEYAFANVVQLESFVIPDTVTKIYKGAFSGNARLKTVTFGAGLVEIGESAFENSAVKNVALSSSVEKIGDKAFKNAKVETVTFGAGLKTVGTEAFYGCDKLTVVDPATATGVALGNYVFSDCISLVKVGATDNQIDLACFASIGSQAFGYLGEEDEDLTYTVVNASAFTESLANIFFGSKIN